MTHRESMVKANERLDNALVALIGKGVRCRVTEYDVRVARQEIRGAVRIIEDALSGPRVSRSRRVAEQVAMTGLERELPL